MLPTVDAPWVGGKRFFIVSTEKLLVMMFFTFGLYWWFCLYRSWRLRGDGRVGALVRVLFCFFFLYGLLVAVDTRLRQSGLEYRWAPSLIVVTLNVAMLFFVGAVCSILLGYLNRASILLLISLAEYVCVAIHVQKAINVCAGDEFGKANSRFTVWNFLWIFIGFNVWPCLVVMTLFLYIISGGGR